MSESAQLTQLPLAEMEAGLAFPVARIAWEPKELTNRLGVQFESGEDDLDRLQGALIRSESGRQFALIRHERQPDPGTDILINERSADPAEDLRAALQTLECRAEDLCWTHPGISPDVLSR